MSAQPVETSSPLPNHQIMMAILLATLTMLFAGFTSAYLVRRAGTDWTAIPMPAILWATTAVLS